MNATRLHAVPKPQSTDATLRALIRERDVAIAEVGRLDREIAIAARSYADERGLTVRPRVEQLRRDLGL